jgi:hypothetical protein
MEFFIQSLMSDTQDRQQVTNKRKRELPHTTSATKRKRSVGHWGKIDAETETCIMGYLDIKSVCSLLGVTERTPQKRSRALARNLKNKNEYMPILKTITNNNLIALSFWEQLLVNNKANAASTIKTCARCTSTDETNKTCKNTGLVMCTGCIRTMFRSSTVLQAFYAKGQLNTVGIWVQFSKTSKLFAACDVAWLKLRREAPTVFLPMSNEYIQHLTCYSQMFNTNTSSTLRYEQANFVYVGHRMYMESKFHPLPFHNIDKCLSMRMEDFNNSTEWELCRDNRMKLHTYVDTHLFHQTPRSVQMFTHRKYQSSDHDFEAHCILLQADILPIQAGWCCSIVNI